MGKGKKKEKGKEKGKKKLSEKVRKARKKPGGSNVGEYPADWKFAGPAGGSPQGSYPINSLKHAKSAIKLAHNAPNPERLKEAVYRAWPQLRPKKGKA